MKTGISLAGTLAMVGRRTMVFIIRNGGGSNEKGIIEELFRNACWPPFAQTPTSIGTLEGDEEEIVT